MVFPPPKFQRFPIHLGLKVENPEPGSIPQNHHWLSMARRMHEAAGLPSLGWGRVLQDGGLEVGVLFCLMIVNGMKLNHAERRRREEPGAGGEAGESREQGRVTVLWATEGCYGVIRPEWLRQVSLSQPHYGKIDMNKVHRIKAHSSVSSKDCL